MLKKIIIAIILVMLSFICTYTYTYIGYVRYISNTQEDLVSISQNVNEKQLINLLYCIKTQPKIGLAPQNKS